jgi:putative transcriptional regulator
VASEYSIEALVTEGLKEESLDRFQQHYYVVTDRLEDDGEVLVRAEYAPEMSGATPAHRTKAESVANLEHHLLVASPRQDDPNFAETVILVIGHNADGSFGVILNCPMPVTVGQIWEELGESSCDSKYLVNAGGPSDGPVMALHTNEPFADVRVVPGVFLSIQKDNVDWIVRHANSPCRIFVGTAYWEAGQLEEEVTQGDWLVLPASRDFLFASPDDLWRNALREFGRSFVRSVGVRHVPNFPGVN